MTLQTACVLVGLCASIAPQTVFADPPAAEEKEPQDTGSALLRDLRAKTEPYYRELAEKGYRLDGDEVLRRVAPPFPNVRMAYYRIGHPTQAQAIPAGPTSMTFRWNGNQLNGWGMLFGSDEGNDLDGVLTSVADVKSQHIEGPSELLQEHLPGDWVVAEGAPQAIIVKQLEQIARDQIGLKVRLEFREVEREIYVASGDYAFKPLPGQPAEEKLQLTDELLTTDPVQIFGEKLDPNSGAGGGTGEVDEFLDWLGRWIGEPIQNEISTAPPRQISWSLHDESPEKRNAERILQNITKQTGLKFEKVTRRARILFVEGER